jgi:long-chain-fatty-acid--[acyl-carrier-protein] ligase
MDPLFLFLLLWPDFRMRPVVIEYVYRLGILKPLMRLVKAIPIPNLDTAINPMKVKRASEALQRMADGIKAGNNFILYPAGKLKSSGKEVIGGASGTHALLQECPGAKIVLVRTTGLWGSSFSRAITGRSPDLPSTLAHGIRVLLKNGIFFAPRRKVEIEICIEPEDFPKKAGRLTFNRYLELWYNKYQADDGKVVDAEPPRLVSFAFWKNEVPKLYESKVKRKNGNAQIADETRQKVYGEIRRVLQSPEILVKPEMNLAADLAMDSLNIAELSSFLMKNYQVDEINPEDFDTVQSVLELAEGSRLSDRPIREMGTAKWPENEEKGRLGPIAPEGKTIVEAFLNSCLRMGNHIACGDDLSGALSYRRMRKAVLVLSQHFKKFPENHVGVLLPASAVAYIVILALLAARKVPVMLNWTLGAKYLNEMLKVGEVKRVISSWRFLDRLAYVDIGEVAEHVVLMEDVKAGLSLGEKLKGAFYSSFAVPSILKRLGLQKMTGDEIAVILFTSGTEAGPKGVPLSHQNILTNERSAMQCLTFAKDEVLYGILPPFHSFGFSVAGLFPLCGGMKIAFYPDPTDSTALAEGINRWRVTLFCAAPSFLRGLFSVAKPEQLKSVRYFVCGAEKAPQELTDRVEALGTGAKLIEGYGITECAPILTLTRLGLPHIGVGQLIPGIEAILIHPENLTQIPDNEDGELCVRGPNVFSGYISGGRSDPFIEIDGKKWYRTGDIGHFDQEHNLILSGRLKRFTKVGGEMISLGAIEEALLQKLGAGDKPGIALIADESQPGKPQLILFSVQNIDKAEVNEILKNAGFSRLVKVSTVRTIDEIPLMGTGKTDYRKLQSYVTENPQ